MVDCSLSYLAGLKGEESSLLDIKKSCCALRTFCCEKDFSISVKVFVYQTWRFCPVISSWSNNNMQKIKQFQRLYSTITDFSVHLQL